MHNSGIILHAQCLKLFEFTKGVYMGITMNVRKLANKHAKLLI